MNTEAMKQIIAEIDALPEGLEGYFSDVFADNLAKVREALAKQEQSATRGGEPVAVKHMMEWVDCLKRKSDYGQFMQIPSGMSAGACWELAVELEQFINTTPQQRKPMSTEQFAAIRNSLARQNGWDGDGWDLALKQAIEDFHNIKG
jgi:hypothetical protein